MKNFLRITVRFLAPVPTFHGQRDGGVPEWPPSPLRLYQALVDAAANRWRGLQFAEKSRPLLEWLERLDQPEILAPSHVFGTPFRISVPNNDLDSPASEWVKGKEPIKPHRTIDLRTMKTIHPSYLRVRDGKLGEALHYLFALHDVQCPHLEDLRVVAQSITHLGWGIDMATGDASVLSSEEASKLDGIRWLPAASGGTPLRAPKPGTIDDLVRKHRDFLHRLDGGEFRPVPPLKVFDIVHYRRQDEPLRRPWRAFELRNTDGSRCRYRHRKLIHIAGMVRHLAIEAMKKDPPRDAPPDWTESYVAGHLDAGAGGHRQFSYLPLPSIGIRYTDPGVRRMLITAPVGDEVWLDHLSRRLAGQMLRPLRGEEFGDREPPLLVPIRSDGVTRSYTRSSSIWHSFTPVILPGHDDHKPNKTRKLIEKSLVQAGVDQPCEFEWSAFSYFAKSFTAHKYDRKKQPQGYWRPSYLNSLTAVHLTLRFHDGSVQKKPVEAPGPFAIGAGRHCGLGLMAAVDD